MLDQYEFAFTHLRALQSSDKWPIINGIAPHKAILLLTSIELIGSGLITKNFIPLNADLQSAYYRNWSVLMGRKPHTVDLMLPFFHLRGDSFWHLVPQRDMAYVLSRTYQPTSLSHLRQLVTGVTFDSALFDLLQEPTVRMVLSTALTRTYLTPSDVAPSLDRPNAKNSRVAVAPAGELSEHLVAITPPPESTAAKMLNNATITLLTDTCTTLLDLVAPSWRTMHISSRESGGSAPAADQDVLGIRTLGDLESLNPIQFLALAQRETRDFGDQLSFWSRSLGAARLYVVPIIAEIIERALFESRNAPNYELQHAYGLHEPLDSVDCAGTSSALLQSREDAISDPRYCYCPLVSEQAVSEILKTQHGLLEDTIGELLIRHRRGLHATPPLSQAADIGEKGTLRIGDVVRLSPAYLFSIPGFNTSSYRALVELLHEQLGSALQNVVQTNVRCAACRRSQHSPSDEVEDLLVLGDLYGLDWRRLQIDALAPDLDLTVPPQMATMAVSAVLEGYSDNEHVAPQIDREREVDFHRAVYRTLIRRLVSHVLGTNRAAPEADLALDSLRAVTVETLIRCLLERAGNASLGRQTRRGFELLLKGHGIWDGELKSMAAMGEEFGLSHQRIQQLISMGRECLRSPEIQPYVETLAVLIRDAMATVGGVSRITHVAASISTLLPFGMVNPEMCIRWLVEQTPTLKLGTEDWIIAYPNTQSDVNLIEQHASSLLAKKFNGMEADALVNHLQAICERAAVAITPEFVQAVLCLSGRFQLTDGVWKLADTADISRDLADMSRRVLQILWSCSRPLHWDELLQSLGAESARTQLLLGECLVANEMVERFGRDYYRLRGRSYSALTDSTPALLGLTDEQVAIADAPPSAKILVTADPGTGKTHLLIARLASLISQYELSPGQDLLVLSFSRAAVREIKRRTSSASNDVRFVQAFTFDSFATRLLAEVDASGDWIDQDYDQRIQTVINTIHTNADARNIVSPFLHVLIDEVQDLVGNRAELVKAILTTCTGGFTLLGDPAQGIYNWNMEGEARHIGSGALYQWLRQRFGGDLQERRLTENFRAETTQAKAPLTLGPMLRDARQNRKHIQAEIGRLLDQLPHLGKVDEVAPVLRASRVPTALLCRTNGQALLVSRKLFELGVPHRLQTRLVDRIVPGWLATLLADLHSSRIGRTAFIETYRSKTSKFLTPDTPDEEAAWRLLKTMDRGVYDVLQLGSVADRIRIGYIPDELLDIPHDNIVVSTTHRAKGLEFDRVVIVEDFDWSADSDSSDDAEELRVMFVALTRTKRELYRIQALSHLGMFNHNRVDRWIRRRGWRTLDFEVRGDDVHRADPMGGFVINNCNVRTVQEYIRSQVRPGDSVRLSRYVTSTSDKSRVFYLVMHDDHPVGVTSEGFNKALFLALKVNRSWRVNWPESVENLRVDAVDTVGWTSTVSRRNDLGESGLWLRVRVSGLGSLVFEARH